MTSTLLLMRHADAEGWSDEGDKGRRLTGQGRQEAAAAALELRQLGVQHVLCSSARRTRETVDCLDLGVPVEYMDALYNCSTETMLQRISEVGDEVQVLLVVAHAPAIPSLSAELSYASAPQQADELQCVFPTASYSHFTLEAGWQDLADDASIRLEGVRRVGL